MLELDLTLRLRAGQALRLPSPEVSVAIPREEKGLTGFCLEVSIRAAGGVTVLFGPSGSGKSLTLQAVAGLVRPDAGRIAVGRRVLFDSAAGIDLPPQARRVGYVPQASALFPHLSVAQNVAFGLDGRSRREIQQAVAGMLSLMGLDELAARRPDQLSGGQQQRVALARALVRRPEVLLLDEPFAALDAPIRAELRAQVCGLQRRFALPTLFVTHDLSEASFVADQIAVLCGGRICQVGLPHEVLMRPADLEVARAVGVKNLLAGRIVEQAADRLVVQVGGSVLHVPPAPFPPGTPVHLCIRSERIILQRKDRPPRSLLNQLHCQIVAEASDGLNCTLFLACSPPLLLSPAVSHLPSTIGHPPSTAPDLQVDLPVYVYERLGLSQDRTWDVTIPPGAIHVLA